LPPGVFLASRGRRVGAYFLSGLLFIVTLGIGYVVWGAVVWGKGTSPALQVLGMRAWRTVEGRPATWGNMFVRDVVDYLIIGISCGIAAIVSFVLFLTDGNNRTIADRVGGTVIVYDPNKVLG
jgi:hypothetical protein